MTDAPQIDDRRRFKELWRELVVARVGVAGLAGALSAVILYYGEYGTSDFGLLLMFISLSLPSAAAKRGFIVLPMVCAAIAASFIAVFVVTFRPVGFIVPVFGPPVHIYVPVVAASTGLAECLLERPWYAGATAIVGGPMFLAPGLAIGLLAQLIVGQRVPVLFFMALMISCHVGIGLSLALGRWIRDLPKRRIPPGEGDGGDAAAS